MSRIRVRNATGADLDDVQVTPAGGARQPLALGPVRRGATSAWARVEVVLRYPTVHASGASGYLVHLPYAGDDQPHLATGSYTYVLRTQGGRLVVDVQPEDAGDLT